MLRGSRAFSGKIHRPFLAHARISRRRLVAKVGTFENKTILKNLHLWPLGPHRRRLAVRSGTYKGSTISQYGCSTFGALATEAQWKEEEVVNVKCHCFNVPIFFFFHLICCAANCFKKGQGSTLFDVHVFAYFASPTEKDKESQRFCARQPVNTKISPYARISVFLHTSRLP